MLSKLIQWFKEHKNMWRLIMHIPVGFLGGVMIMGAVILLLSFPSVVSTGVAILLAVGAYIWYRAFLEYELNEDLYHLKDGAYLDIIGFLTGFAMAVIIGIISIWSLAMEELI